MFSAAMGKRPFSKRGLVTGMVAPRHKTTGGNRAAAGPRAIWRLPLAALGWALVIVAVAPRLAAQTPPASLQKENTTPAQSNPESSSLPNRPALKSADSCEVKNAAATLTATGAVRALSALSGDGTHPLAETPAAVTRFCVPYLPIVDWYARFVTGPEVKPFTPAEKGRLALHNLTNLFNLATIAGEAAISTASNSHSPYGPGIPGWGREMGVSFTQDMTGEFFGTFLIPSLVHQDPHYHRMPNAKIPRRVLHCVLQVGWTQGDNGRGMVNYSLLGGSAIDGAISNLYVPGQQTRVSATATRYLTGLSTAPIENFITEFLPTIASHIHTHDVFVQRIVNQVAKTNNSQ
jgi:hypothetical protein